MFDFFRRWIARLETTSTPESRERARRAAAWAQELPMIEARRLAYQVLDRGSWFDCDPADPRAALPHGLPLTVSDLYSRFRLVRGLGSDLTLDAEDVAPSGVNPQFCRIGWIDEDVELCVRGEDDRVHYFPTATERVAAVEDSLPSIYHVIVGLAAMLGYLPVPEQPRPPKGDVLS